MADRMPRTPAPEESVLRFHSPTWAARAHDWSRQAVEQGVQAIGATVRWPVMDRAEAGPLYAFLVGRRGQARPFELVLPQLERPRGAGLAAAAPWAGNSLAWSERLSVAPWTYTAGVTVPSNVAMPAAYGYGRQGQLVTADAGAGDWPYVRQGAFGLGGRIVGAVDLKYHSALRQYVRLLNSTRDISHGVVIQWAAGVPTVQTLHNVDAYGLTATTGGWFRLWFAVDLEARDEAGDTFNWYLYPKATQDTVAASLYAYGAQLSELPAGAALADVPYVMARGAVPVVREPGPRVLNRSNVVPLSTDLHLWPTRQRVQDSGLGWPDPWGTSVARRISVSTTGGAYLHTGVIGALEADNVASAYVRAGTATAVKLNLYNTAIPRSHTVEVNLAGAVPVVAGVSLVDGYGCEAVPGFPGWYRLWLWVDAETRGELGGPAVVWLYPDTTNTVGAYSYLTGAQLEHGRQQPGPYLATAGAAVLDQPNAGGVLYVDGLEPGAQQVLAAGDYLRVPGHTKVHMVLADVAADAGGVGAVQLVPDLLTTPAAGAALELEDVPLTVALTGDVVELPTSKPELYQLEADVLEVW